MKPDFLHKPSLTSSSLLVAALASLSTPCAHAADWYWDSNGNTAGAGTTPVGTWGSSSFWSTDSAGTLNTTAWSTGNTAVFAAGTDATGTYNVTISGTQSTAGLKFEEGNVTLTGGTGITLTAAAVDVASGSTGTISTAIGGSAGLNKTGAGTLTLSGVNGYTGTTSVAGGTLVIASGGSSSSATGQSNVAAGATLEISGTFSTTTAGQINTTGGTGTGTIDIKAGGTINAGGSNGVIIGQNTANHNGVLNVSGTYSQTAASFYLGNANSTSTGTLTINNGGRVTFGTGMAASSASGTGAAAGVVLGRDSATGTINLETGGTLETAKNIIRGTGTGRFNFNGGTLKVLANSTNTGLDVTTTTINAGGAIVNTNGYDFLITDGMQAGTGSGGLTKNGDGTLTLSGNNTYTGKTNISGGSLKLASTGSINNSSEIALNGGNLNVTSVSSFAVGSTKSLTGSGSVTGNIAINGTLAIGNLPGSVTFDNNLTLGGTSTSNFEITAATYGINTYDLAQGRANSQMVTFDGILNLYFNNLESYGNGTSVKIFDFETYTGGFDTVNFSGLGVGQSATFDAATGVVSVIPEPSAALLGGLGVLCLLRRRRN